MKWGRRRFQEKDGRLTSAGEKRYDDEKTSHKISRVDKLASEYEKSGYSKKEAQMAAQKRARIEKILMVSAGVTVAACAAYAVHNHLKDQVDGVIKSGESLQRIEMRDTGGKLNDMFYAAKGDHDSNRYKGLLGFTRQRQTGEAYLMKLQARNTVKVASKNHAAEAFGKLYKNDPSFRESVEGYVAKHFGGENRVDTKNMSPANIKKMYENFNSNLIGIREAGNGADKKFYSELKKAGYGAIQDINDMKYSGYNAKNPLIVFDNASQNIMVQSVSKLTSSLQGDYAAEQIKSAGEEFVKKTMQETMPLAAVGLTTTAATVYNTKPSSKVK